MKDTPILEELKNFKNKKYTKFFMPSHLQLNYHLEYSDTQKEVFKMLKEFEKNIFSLDVTEVNNFDNLSNPNGIIKKSQDIVADSFDAKKVYFLVNGSTVGIISMILSVLENNDKVIIQKNSHKFVHNACNIKKLNVVYIESEENKEFDIYKKIDIKRLEDIIKKNKDAKAIVITSSDYYGQNQEIKKIKEICSLYGMYLLVDAAHCANYNYSELFDDFPIKYADIVVTSFHKTLPSINQTAILTVNKSISDDICNRIRENINIFQTTSPSYILLSSIEIANSIMSMYGATLYNELYTNISLFKQKIETLNKYVKNKIKILNNDDFSRLVISVENMKIEDVYNYLKNDMILVEMMNEKSIVLICNIFHTYKDFEKIFVSLEKLSKLEKASILEERDIIKKEQQENKEDILLYLQNNLGEKSEKNIYLYPPGAPMIAKGDIITKCHIKKIQTTIKNNIVDIIF